MTNTTPSQPAKPAAPAPAPAPAKPTESKRVPLPQPGDKDYVAGQPVSDEEAEKTEKDRAPPPPKK